MHSVLLRAAQWKTAYECLLTQLFFSHAKVSLKCDRSDIFKNLGTFSNDHQCHLFMRFSRFEFDTSLIDNY